MSESGQEYYDKTFRGMVNLDDVIVDEHILPAEDLPDIHPAYEVLKNKGYTEEDILDMLGFGE